MGNPHAVVFVDDLGDARGAATAAGGRAAVPRRRERRVRGARGDRHVAMRVHERGVGETRSCGTGACAGDGGRRPARRRRGRRTSYVVDVPGGRLTVTARADGHVELTGRRCWSRAASGPVTTEPPVGTAAMRRCAELVARVSSRRREQHLLGERPRRAARTRATPSGPTALVHGGPRRSAHGRARGRRGLLDGGAHGRCSRWSATSSRTVTPMLWLEAAETVLPTLARTGRARAARRAC